MSLTGLARGATRADIIRTAKDAAAKYYGETCIDVALSNEETLTVSAGSFSDNNEQAITGYTANWEATVKHRMWENTTYGFPKCRNCDYEDRSR